MEPCGFPVLSTKNRNLWRHLKIRKTLPGLMNFDFCCDLMSTWIHEPKLPCFKGSAWTWWWWCDAVGNVFLAHTWPLNINRAWFECYSYFQDDNVPCQSCLKLAPWTWQWVQCTSPASLVTGPESKRAPSGFGRMADSQNEIMQLYNVFM